MSRYVDIEPLDVVGTKGVSKDYVDGMAYVLDLLDNLPSADVEPVRHGRWIADLTNPYGMRYICSECDVKRRFRSNYCPNCGAKMDKEEYKNG